MPLKFRFPIQLLTSTLQLYGDVLYYYTAILEGTDKYCLPTILHYYVYFIAMNAIWIVIPSLSIWTCIQQIGHYVSHGQSIERAQKRVDDGLSPDSMTNGDHKKKK